MGKWPEDAGPSSELADPTGSTTATCDCTSRRAAVGYCVTVTRRPRDENRPDGSWQTAWAQIFRPTRTGTVGIVKATDACAAGRRVSPKTCVAGSRSRAQQSASRLHQGSIRRRRHGARRRRDCHREGSTADRQRTGRIASLDLVGLLARWGHHCQGQPEMCSRCVGSGTRRRQDRWSWSATFSISAFCYIG